MGMGRVEDMYSAGSVLRAQIWVYVMYWYTYIYT